MWYLIWIAIDYASFLCIYYLFMEYLIDLCNVFFYLNFFFEEIFNQQKFCFYHMEGPNTNITVEHK